jgi:hypothetical protein
MEKLLRYQTNRKTNGDYSAWRCPYQTLGHVMEIPNASSALNRWVAALRPWAPSFLSDHPLLRNGAAHGVLLLHGSTTRDVDDDFSDLDLWLLVPESLLPLLTSGAGTRFFPFRLQGKEGHVNVHAIEEFAQRLAACDLPLVAELRQTTRIAGPHETVSALVEQARQPMPQAVRAAWARYHYVLMRQAHRALDNPIERGDATTVFLGVAATVEHALRAALVLDGEPYPYVKWLHRAASTTPTGQKIVPLAGDVLDLLAQGALFEPGPEREHRLSRKIKEIRAVLIASARDQGLDGPWLEQWWLYIDAAREGVSRVTWGDA